MNNKKKKEYFDSELVKLVKFANQVKDEVAEQTVHTEDSYETYRDSFRFMTNLTLISVIFSFVFLSASLVIFFTKPMGETYATTQNGNIIKITPVAVR
jgi:hypothetical protein